MAKIKSDLLKDIDKSLLEEVGYKISDPSSGEERILPVIVEEIEQNGIRFKVKSGLKSKDSITKTPLPQETTIESLYLKQPNGDYISLKDYLLSKEGHEELEDCTY